MGVMMDQITAGGVQHPDGTLVWRDQASELHREDGPAVIYADGTQRWYLHGRPHRLAGPAVIRADGYQAWWRHDQLHRDDGPAVTWPDGGQAWYVHGRLHRTAGPAVMHADGEQEWHVLGRDVTAEVEAWLAARGTSWPLAQEQQAELVLRWG